LRGTGKGRPLLLLAHSDVSTAGDPKLWTVDPFSAENRGGFIYGRGTLSAKSLLAADLAVMVEIKRRKLELNRDLILVSEAGEEQGGTGIQWLIQNAWSKIDAEFALNEGASIWESKDGFKVFQIQTLEKVPTPMILAARGTAVRGGVPRPDNPVVRFSAAVGRLSEADQDAPVHLNATTKRYLQALATKISDYSWLAPLLPALDTPGKAQTAAAAQIRMRDLDLYSMLHTTVIFGDIRSRNRAPLDVRRMPSETREEVLARLRQVINDSSIDLSFAPGQPVPATEPSSTSTALYRAMESAIARVYPRESLAVPFMGRNATDSSYLRSRGMAVYGVPVFLREPGESRVRNTDERIATKSLDEGVELLWQMVLETTGGTSL
jgi:acetylornithine deacetylase/succinyl-diaminopimelate desuccinylase-like protein